MAKARNILFVMCDQLRWDYVGYAKRVKIDTPNIDKLARMGVRFDRTFVNSPVCGPSRMSFYTGRTVFSHGATWNYVPLPIGELTLGDYLASMGVRVALTGKTHMRGDSEAMARLGLSEHSEIGVRIAEGAFEPIDHDDGIHPNDAASKDQTYNVWLRSLGYDGVNPWHTWANSSQAPDGEIISGWNLRSSQYPARVKEEHSETPYITQRGIDFMRETGERPWLLHLSYIKPHWPCVAPAPYHAIYSAADVPPAVRADHERDSAHPVHKAFMDFEVSRSFSKDHVRDVVIPAYMGLIKQIDDQLARVFAYLEENGRMQDTMIVFTSDHGDYLGDHWLGEKELFHEPSLRVPLIIYDPDPAADATRGTVCEALVEAIDLVPTFLDALDCKASRHRLEGRSLLPFLRGPKPTQWRDAVFSEIDYGTYDARDALGRGANDCRGYMIRTERWKYAYFKGFRPQLFDLQEDPDELVDRGADPALEAVRRDLHARLLERLTDRRNRVSVDDAWILGLPARERAAGVFIGRW